MMEINIVFIIVIAIFAVFMILGYLRGIMGIIFGVASWVFFFLFVNIVSPMTYDNLVGSEVRDKVFTSVYSYLDDNTTRKVKKSEVKKDGALDVDALSQLLAEQYEITLPTELLPDNAETETVDIRDMIEKSSLDKKVKKNINKARVQLLAQVSTLLTLVILRGMATILTAVIAMIICLVVMIIVTIVTKLPIIGEANRGAGLTFGAVEGLLVVWILMYIISFSGASDWGQDIMSMIENNVILKFLYENNLIPILTQFGKIFIQTPPA